MARPESYQEMVGPPGSGSGATSANNKELAVQEGRLTWLVYIIGAAVGGRVSFNRSDHRRTTFFSFLYNGSCLKRSGRDQVRAEPLRKTESRYMVARRAEELKRELQPSMMRNHYSVRQTIEKGKQMCEWPGLCV